MTPLRFSSVLPLTLVSRYSRMSPHAEIISLASRLIPPLSHELHKGQAGRIGVIGGSADYTGAPFFAGMTTLRLGADLAHIICEESAGNVIKTYSPDLIVHTDLSSSSTESSLTSLYSTLLPRLHTLIIGPGLGRSSHMQLAALLALKLAREEGKFVVVDADGLWMIANAEGGVKSVQGYERCVLTPNKVEMGRLCEAVNLPKDSSASALSSALGGVTILLKGPSDIISSSTSSETLKNEVQGSARRCGGQGDVLSGAVGCFLAWGKSYEERLVGDSDSDSADRIPSDRIPLLASYAASTLTRTASRMTFARLKRGMQTSDLIEDVPRAFEEVFGEGAVGEVGEGEGEGEGGEKDGEGKGRL